MKSVVVTIEATKIVPGDVFIISHSHPRRGGRSDARFDVPPETDTIQQLDGQKIVVTSETTLTTVVQGLITAIDRWDGFEAKPRGENQIIILCQDAVAESVFTGNESDDHEMRIEEY